MPPSSQHRERLPVPRQLPQSARSRLLLALGAAAIGAYCAKGLGPALRVLVALNSRIWVLIGMVWVMLLTADTERTRARAAVDDEVRVFVHVVVLAATMLSLVVATAALRDRGISRYMIEAWL